jgi:SNF2 family DNA or RNA helicase
MSYRGQTSGTPSELGDCQLTLSRHLKPDAINYCIYYGKDRATYLRELQNYDLVITTYSVVVLDWKAMTSPPEGRHILHDRNWGRIVLDEGNVPPMHTASAFLM